MNKQLVDQLASHVGRLVSIKNDLQLLQLQAKELRQSLQKEEEDIALVMNELSIGECNTSDVTVKLASCKKQPTASFKNILPLIERVFNASPTDMANFMEEVKSFKQSNACEVKKVVCKTKKDCTATPKQKLPLPKAVSSTANPKPSVANPSHQKSVPTTPQSTSVPTPSLASALSGL